VGFWGFGEQYVTERRREAVTIAVRPSPLYLQQEELLSSDACRLEVQLRYFRNKVSPYINNRKAAEPTVVTNVVATFGIASSDYNTYLTTIVLWRSAILKFDAQFLSVLALDTH